ncbi:MAG TPA: YhfC family intramembrane metalloprotease, partial [Chloroflexi bacterium]|nr:YhfC family intramembrane metalloprotease [Chloroflexota bacterium]
MLAFFHFLNALLMILLPLGLAIYLTRRFGLDWGLFGVGAVSFISSQVLHLPFNAWVLNPFL